MNKLLIAVVLSCPLSAHAIEGKAGIKPGQTVRIAVDQGELRVVSGASDSLSYQVEFVPEGRTWSFFGLFGKGSSSQACEGCSASYDAEKGDLRVHSGSRFRAVVKVGVPKDQRLDVQLAVGTADIGPLVGKIAARVDVGTLAYDASSLPVGVCVEAFVKIGAVSNARDVNCKSVGATLHTRTGTISVN